jgi:hypothetical protein
MTLDDPLGSDEHKYAALHQKSIRWNFGSTENAHLFLVTQARIAQFSAASRHLTDP